MRTGAKLGAYGLLLAAVLGGGAAVGAAAGPIDVDRGGTHATRHESEGDAGVVETGELPARGLLVSQDGYRFEPEDQLADVGELAFTIVGPEGHAVVQYDELHDRELHLIVVSRDLREYVHLHPERDARDRWTVHLPKLPAGSYRAFADFQPAGGSQYTLGVDLVAPGISEPASEPLRPRTTDAVDGFDVDLEPSADNSQVSVTVRRDGRVVTTEPYLGAAGHLVALRDGDLAYLHVHPVDEAPAGPVRFAIDVPSPGTYALFFDFQVGGVVRSARFVLEATTSPAGPATPNVPSTEEDHGRHDRQ